MVVMIMLIIIVGRDSLPGIRGNGIAQHSKNQVVAHWVRHVNDGNNKKWIYPQETKRKGIRWTEGQTDNQESYREGTPALYLPTCLLCH